MIPAIANTGELESSDAWLAKNLMTWCHQMSAKLSAAACEQHRNNPLNGRCFRCGGLEDQTPQNQELPGLNITVDEDCIEGLEAADESIDGLYEDPVPGDGFENIEIDLNDEQILALFPELANTEEEDNEINYPRFTEFQETMPRYAVYHGRCKRDGGYMQNIREFNDNAVFRCLSCGWRDGVEYSRNRSLQAAGGVIL